MRWKLLLLASLVAAVLSFGLWCALTIALFGTAAELARHDWILLLSFLLPLGLAIYAGVFVYRHTARRRKTQALMTAILTILLASLAYSGAVIVAHDRFVIPRTDEVRHAR